MHECEHGGPSRDHARCDLNLDSRKRNVFVTQLEEGRDEEENDVTQIPIIKEAASKILDTSKNTLQKTLVLKKEVEYDRVSEELLAKRQEYKVRMQTLDKKKEGFAQKQIECLDKAGKFERFLKDGEAKRRKAIVKYQTEAKQNDLRQTELDELAKQLGGMRARQQKLHEKLAKNTIYEDFLIKIVDNVPENYLEHGVDSPVRAIIRRHETLSITNESLVNSLTTLADEQERKQYQLETLQRRHDTSKLLMNSDVSQLQKQYDTIQEKNKQLELNFNMDKGQFRQQSVELGRLAMAISNLAEQCQMKHHRPALEVELLQKLDMIKEFTLEKMNVEKMAMKLSEVGFVIPDPGDPAPGSNRTRFR